MPGFAMVVYQQPLLQFDSLMRDLKRTPVSVLHAIYLFVTNLRHIDHCRSFHGTPCHRSLRVIHCMLVREHFVFRTALVPTTRSNQSPWVCCQSSSAETTFSPAVSYPWNVHDRASALPNVRASSLEMLRCSFRGRLSSCQMWYVNPDFGDLRKGNTPLPTAVTPIS